MQQKLYKALLNPDLMVPEGLTAWNGSDPAVRFAVYRNNVITSLIDALAENCPVLVAQLGEGFFRAMAAEFIRQQPPSSPVLAGYGAKLPDWIATFQPLADWPWLSDLTRLEMLFIESLHAADPTEQTTEAAPVDDPTQLRMVLHPSVRLFSSDYAVFSLWAAHQQSENEMALDPFQPEHMLLCRVDDDVRIMLLSRAEMQFIAMLQSGQCLTEALEIAAREDATFEPQPVLQRMQHYELILSLYSNTER
ncbi:DNA-binding domain-containing protein [Photorhabdus aegyptia]|uniref:HvfC/BufC N-terminal domain-containing protein n=1 Tax=Photorhabdus aegyptia TaxID=2805098 RepID=UPI001E6086A9|nr:DNA-binding domain-containing protein [Photorhabdus aegyptia]MCC8456438.1 putative DNA-binding domain-containing protein [Photorhabdus aegyptia]